MIRFPFPVWLFAMRGFFTAGKPEISCSQSIKYRYNKVLDIQIPYPL